MGGCWSVVGGKGAESMRNARARALTILNSLPYSARSYHSLPSFRFVLNQSRSFLASCSARSVVSYNS
eukprot:scaffold28116_cov110-Isochrysis_galbana.AAC.7